MNVVYLVQVGVAGGDGPVTIGTSTDKGVTRKLNSLQLGNPRVLTIVDLLDADERLEWQLRVRWEAHRIRGSWYRADVLKDLPDVQRVVRDIDAEARRQAVDVLKDLGG